ncbi:MAG: hypothetical protein GVY09_12600 [Gammaproteobacteria bacterium]|jgi:hypothetical protein|nr:hypothetical protein [Gammaproteobacteria bacterium]
MGITYEPVITSPKPKSPKRRKETKEQPARPMPKLEIDERDLEKLSDAFARNEAPVTINVVVKESLDRSGGTVTRVQLPDDNNGDDLNSDTSLVTSILQKSEMLSAEEFGKRCGVSRQTVNTWRAERRILALSGPKRRFLRYPSWQITDRGDLLPGLERVLAVLSEAWEAYDFLTGRWSSLDNQTAWATLAAGRLEEVMKALESYRSADYQ